MTPSDSLFPADLRSVADMLRRAGELDEARGMYERALDLCDDAQDDAGAAACREGLGRTALDVGDLRAGLEHLLLAYGHHSSHHEVVEAARCSYRAILPLVL
ncbi:tetratricopeptide repeat protein [Dietzia maris]|uniref:tetratricopeptide repeat protein n=1 Tax=Dietzia maris TaxID=37915 RepID=UPI00341BF1CC